MVPGARFWVQILDLLFTGCVTRSKVLNLSELWFLHCKKKGKQEGQAGETGDFLQKPDLCLAWFTD